MISSFFSKSKPIHFVIVSVILLFVFLSTTFFSLENNELNLLIVFRQIGLFLVSLSSVFILEFLVSRNKLTNKNSYQILFFVLFMALFPETILNTKALLANLFILLALRRLVSLRTQKELKKKIFDAAFWISIATLLYFWAALFFILIFAALILFSISDFKNWIVPITGILTVLIISTAYMITKDIDFLDYFINLYAYSLDFSQLNSKSVIIAATLLFSYGIWSLFYFIKQLQFRAKNYRPAFMIIIIAVIIAVLIIMIAPFKNGSEFIFLFAPLAIIITNYIELVTEKWFKEVLVIVLAITPILILML